VAVRKTRAMMATERRWGIPIERLLPELYYDRNQSHSKVALQLGVSEATLYVWWRRLRAAGVVDDQMPEPREAVAV
jgi:transposase